MSEVNIFGDYSTSDWILATLLSYSGYAINRCTGDGRNENTVWTFQGIPSEDLKIYQEEAARPDTSVMLLDFIQAQKAVKFTQAQAKRNFGIYTGAYYAKQAGAS
jgi:hypothetical protein